MWLAVWAWFLRVVSGLAGFDLFGCPAGFGLLGVVFWVLVDLLSLGAFDWELGFCVGLI